MEECQEQPGYFTYITRIVYVKIKSELSLSRDFLINNEETIENNNEFFNTFQPVLARRLKLNRKDSSRLP